MEAAMIALDEQQKIQILGGCCGTDSRHLEALFQYKVGT